MISLSEVLEAIANQFHNVAIPQPIVQWGYSFLHAVLGFKLGLSI